MIAAAVIDEARAWIDTPFGHQGRILGHRIDCAGLIARVGADLGLSTFDATDYGHR
jgi:cell wall-associated NlpC family hydrolase